MNCNNCKAKFSLLIIPYTLSCCEKNICEKCMNIFLIPQNNNGSNMSKFKFVSTCCKVNCKAIKNRSLVLFFKNTLNKQNSFITCTQHSLEKRFFCTNEICINKLEPFCHICSFEKHTKDCFDSLIDMSSFTNTNVSYKKLSKTKEEFIKEINEIKNKCFLLMNTLLNNLFNVIKDQYCIIFDIHNDLFSYMRFVKSKIIIKKSIINENYNYNIDISARNSFEKIKENHLNIDYWYKKIMKNFLENICNEYVMNIVPFSYSYESFINPLISNDLENLKFNSNSILTKKYFFVENQYINILNNQINNFLDYRESEFIEMSVIDDQDNNDIDINENINIKWDKKRLITEMIFNGVEFSLD